MGDGLMAL